MKNHIPNAITCLNLFSGCVGIVFAFNGQLEWASAAILISAVFDFFDGMIARLLKAYSEIGKELDSLADMVSFGVLPSVIIFQLFQQAPLIEPLHPYLDYSAFLIAVFSGLRLAKFNIDHRQTENFIGLPTPANAKEGSFFLASYIMNPFFLFIFSLGMGLLLVSEIPLMSLKFKNLDFNQNIYRYSLLAISLICIVFFKFAAVPIIIFIYIILSIIQFRLIK